MGIRIRLPDLNVWKSQVLCQTGCPVATDPGRYAQLITEGRIEEGYLVARSPNPFASVCGRVCAAPCEDACRRGFIDAPLTLRAMKRYLCERYGVESVRPDTQDRLRAELITEGNRYPGHLPVERFVASAEGRRKVAVIGAGVAGMSCAHDLALLGYDVTVFEAGDEAGGMMRFGIPEYRLPRSVIRSEIDKILSLGVTLRLGTPLTADFGLRELRRDGFESVFLAVGVSKGRDIQIPGIELDGVVKAIDYLLNVNRGYRVYLGQRVVVIGGGFVAFDAARTALRLTREEQVAQLSELGAEGDARLMEALDAARSVLRAGAGEVVIVSLETFDEMPVLRSEQGHEEFEEAKNEGVEFITRRGPKRFVGERRLEAVELRKVLRVFDDDGRFSPQYDDSDITTLPADSCILAIGQRANLSFLKDDDHIDLTPGGTIKVNPETLATSAPGIFAGGDVAFGPRNLIEGVANGKRAARSIHRFLSAESAGTTANIDIEKIPTRRFARIAGYELYERKAPQTLDVGRRTGIAEVEVGYSEEGAILQGSRCLICHVQTIYDPGKCVLCNRCVDVCPEYCLALVPLETLDVEPELKDELMARAEANGLPLSAMLKDDDRCIRCGLCAIRCPTDAMTMERFAITERYVATSEPAAR